MSKYCPISFTGAPPRCCDNKCALYKDGCLIEQALTIYIEEHKPITIAPENYSFEEIMYMVESMSDSNMIAP